MALEESQVLSIVAQELSDSVGGTENGYIDSNRQNALSAYLGNADGKEKDGRSKIVSTDVADAIEWIMPEVVKAFTQNNEVVTFDATSSKDEQQAEMESRFVYDILMKDNNGFIIIHQFIKDALMQKNGFIKVYYEEDVHEQVEIYTGIDQNTVQSLLSDASLEIVEMSEEDTGIDIKVKRSKSNSKVAVVSVPPEEFRVNKNHNSVDVSGARFSAHIFEKTCGDLIAEGYSKDVVDSIPTSESYDDGDYRFYMQDESAQSEGSNSIDPSLRVVEIAECFMHIDMDEDGIAEYVKITVAGGDNPTDILDAEVIDSSPFISATAILMSHKLFGLSIYDRLKQIQEQKTTLWRNIFDNMYLQNNQRTVVVENQVNLDDLMVSRPGGIIRAKRLDAVAPYVTPPLSGDAYKMMDYLDQIRASRSGVTPEGPVTDSMIGDRVGSEGVQSMMSQKEELVGLMIRVIAETGIKPLCYKIREEVSKHHDVAQEYKFRGQWIQTNPTMWASRKHSTVRVGTGSGNRKEQQAAITNFLTIQERMLANPQQAMVNEAKVFKALDDFAKFSGMPGAESYFVDPNSPEGQQLRQQKDQSAQQSQQAEMEQKQKELEFQNKIADAETSKAQTAAMNVQLKAQVDNTKNQLVNQKQMLDAQLAAVKQQLAEAESIISADEQSEELRFKYYNSKLTNETQRMQIKANAKAASDNNKDSGNE